MTRAVDVVVLGAGVVGVTTAYALVQRGFTVAIADRRAGPGLETSYANGGQLSYAYSDALASPGLLRKLPFMVTGGDPAFDLKLSADPRSEEHTSELQSLMSKSYAVFCLKKKKKSQKQREDSSDNIILNQ